MHGTADGDVQRAHLVIADESLPATRVVRVERPSAVERLQRVTDRLRHDPASELFVDELPVGTLNESKQVGGLHDVLVSPGEWPACLVPRLARRPFIYFRPHGFAGYGLTHSPLAG